jgi:hypothetical protein
MIAVCVTKATECVDFVTQTAIFPGGIANQDSRAGLWGADLIVVRLQTAATRCAEVQSPSMTSRAAPKNESADVERARPMYAGGKLDSNVKVSEI